MRDFSYSFGRNVSFSIKNFAKILKIDELHISIYSKSYIIYLI